MLSLIFYHANEIISKINFDWYNPGSMGTIAEWFSGILTAVGIYLGIATKKVKIKMNHKYDGNNYIITVKNKSNMNITLGGVFVHVYSKKFGKEVLNQYQNPVIDNSSGKNAPYILKIGGTKEESFEVDFPSDTSDKQSEYKKVYIKYGVNYNGDSIKEKPFKRKIKLN